MPNTRNQTLELLKLFASYMVVFIHVLFYGKIGTAMNALARFAVPLFFLISGFYSYNVSLDKLKKRTIHITFLLVFSAILYTAWNTIFFLYKGNFTGVFHYFSDYFNFKSLLKLFIFNTPVHTTHLWYLLAIIYVYITFYFVSKYKVSENFIFITSFLLLALHILLGELFSVLGFSTPIILVRNFALFGIPFFGIGMFIKKSEQHLKKVPSIIIFISLITGVLETLFSRFLFGKNELYIGSLFILFAIIVIFIKYDNKKYSHILTSLTGCSTYIYIIHPLLSSFIHKIYRLGRINFQSSITLQMIHPLLICLLSTVFAYGIQQIINKLNHKI